MAINGMQAVHWIATAQVERFAESQNPILEDRQVVAGLNGGNDQICAGVILGMEQVIASDDDRSSCGQQTDQPIKTVICSAIIILEFPRKQY